MNDTTHCLADHHVHRDGQTLLIESPAGAGGHPTLVWGWDRATRRLQCEGAAPGLGAALAAIGTALSDLAGEKDAALALQAPAELAARLRALGIALPADGQLLSVPASLFWQCQAGWMPQPAPPMPLAYRMSDGRRHPLRRAKPQGEVYRRRIDWLGQTLSFQVADIEADLPHFHRWMNDPHVAAFWQEEGDLAQQRAYLERVSADPHSLPLIAFLDGRPFGYFEAYWAKEDRLAPFYDAQDYDRGWHVLIGEADCRGAAYVSAWLPSISHYLFLDDCRTQRLVIEPRADNGRMRRNLARSGYALVKEFDFPHKRALLGTLLRERFFADHLWLPQPA